MWRVTISEDAVNDLERIQDYYRDHELEEYGFRLTTELVETQRRWSSFPESFGLLQYPEGRFSETDRFFPYKEFKVVFRPYDEELLVIIGFIPDAIHPRNLSLRFR